MPNSTKNKNVKKLTELVDSLHPLERKALPFLDKTDNLKGLVEKTGLQEVEVMRTLQWLENKKILTQKIELKEMIIMLENAKQCLKEGFPEKRFLNEIKETPKTIDEIQKSSKLTKQELYASLGILKSKVAINQGNKIEITEQGKKLISHDSLEEKFLKKSAKEEIELKKLNPEEKFAYDNLKKRKGFVKLQILKLRSYKLSELGKKLTKEKIEDDISDTLTPKMLKEGSWKNKKFRRYDVEINVPKINRGKRHFVAQAIKSAKRIWLDMGFEEMTGTYVQTSFWNFDALFTAQDHPVREMQDTFFIKSPKNGKLPKKEIIERIKKTHENGWTTKSTGWRYRWEEDEAKKNVLRTHTTVLSAKTIASLKKEDLPKKFFAVGRCFRNETMDWSHLFEFNQTEGIVIDENANFRNLLGYLKQFFKKMGYEKARFRPAYFPYTEFSTEIEVWHPVHKKWFELGGAGIFRPEVVKPLLGIDVPVLAWGPGFDRIILEFFKINDIRELYKNDLKQLREIKEWMK